MEVRAIRIVSGEKNVLRLRKSKIYTQLCKLQVLSLPENKPMHMHSHFNLQKHFKIQALIWQDAECFPFSSDKPLKEILKRAYCRSRSAATKANLPSQKAVIAATAMQTYPLPSAKL